MPIPAEIDDYGNLWFKTDHKKGPVIFPCKKVVDSHNGREVVRTGKFIALVSVHKGFIFEGNDLKRFDSADDAYAAIRVAV